MKNVRRKRTKEKRKKAKGEEKMQKIVRRESLGAVHTHTHTHTSNLEKTEKRVGKSSTLKVMEKDRQKEEGKKTFFLTACLFCVLYTRRREKLKQKECKREGVENG